jgi:hypothetical protein
MKFDNATAADVWLIVCYWDCRHQVETDPAELARHSAIFRLPGAFSNSHGLDIACVPRHLWRTILEREAEARSQEPASRRALGQE